jgi:hypothetical protein
MRAGRHVAETTPTGPGERLVHRHAAGSSLAESAARIAALEQLLIEKGLSSHDDLKRARAFIYAQDAS